ncbi:hypothetical protein Tco_0691485 [Tanacetum coccineum]
MLVMLNGFPFSEEMSQKYLCSNSGIPSRKVQGTDSYEFLLANKKCIVNAEVFKTILDICLRVKGVDFTDVPDDDTALTFLINLGKDYQEYGLPIPETMLTNAIKQSESYQMFIKYSTSQIRPKKSRGKGSHGKKIAGDSQKTVDVSKDSEPEPEPVKKKTSSKGRVKKKVTLSADDNIISDDPDVALELAKSISQNEAEEAKAARKFHAAHARIVTESVPGSAKKKAGGRSSKSVFIQDTPSASKSNPATTNTKLKGAPTFTLEEQEAANIMQALKESKKTSRRQPGTGGSNKGTGSKPGVPDESTVISATSSEGTCIKPGVPDQEKDITKDKVILEWGDEQDSEHSNDDNDDVEKDDKDGDADDASDDHISDTQDANDKDVETESDEDDICKYKIHVHKDEDEEMINAEVDDSDKGDEEITDAVKADAEKTSEVKDDPKKTELPPSSSSLSVFLGFGDQFLKLSSDSSLVNTVKDTIDTKINSLLEVKIHSEVPHIQSLSMLSVPVSVISEPIVPTPVKESPSTTTTTTLPPPSISTTPSVPQQTKTLIPTLTITTDAPTITTAILESNALTAIEFRFQVPSVVDNYLGSKVGDVFQKELKKHTNKDPRRVLQRFYKSRGNKLRSNRSQSLLSSLLTRQLSKSSRSEYDLKSALDPIHAWQTMGDTVKDHKRKHDDDDEDPPAGPNQSKKTKRIRTKECESSKKPSSTKETPKGKALTKGSKVGKFAFAKEPVEEPIAEVVMDDAGDDVTCDDNQPKAPQNQNKKDSESRLNNLEGDRYPFDLSKPLPLQGLLGHRTVVVDYFFNNDLEYLKTSDLEVTYTSSITKTKAARYEIKGIEEMVSKFSKHNVYSTKAILGVKSVSVKKLHGYGHLEEIVVKRSDPQLHKFKEGDFIDLHLNDIEDMLLLTIQHKLFHLDGSVIVEFIMALCMFTRSLILKRRVEDLQLGVESYQKKLNITKPHKTFLEIEFKEPYTPSYDPPGIVYEDLNKQKRVLQADELYKFSDGTLKSVRDEIHHRVLNFHLDYNTDMPKRKWTAVDRKRSRLMTELIDKQLREREIIKNLERLVSARELKMDYKLITRTV